MRHSGPKPTSGTPHPSVPGAILPDALFRQALYHLAEATVDLEKMEPRIRRAEALVTQLFFLMSEEEDEVADEAD